MQDVIPEDLRLRDAQKIVGGPQQHRAFVRNQSDEARGVHPLPEHPPPARAEVVRLKRRKAVVVSGEDVHGVDDDEAQHAVGPEFGGIRADVQRAFQLFPDCSGVDEKEGPALVPHKLGRLMEKALQCEPLARLRKVGEQ
jgi:hypothetical protein